MPLEANEAGGRGWMRGDPGGEKSEDDDDESSRRLSGMRGDDDGDDAESSSGIAGRDGRDRSSDDGVRRNSRVRCRFRDFGRRRLD